MSHAHMSHFDARVIHERPWKTGNGKCSLGACDVDDPTRAQFTAILLR